MTVNFELFDCEIKIKGKKIPVCFDITDFSNKDIYSNDEENTPIHYKLSVSDTKRAGCIIYLWESADDPDFLDTYDEQLHNYYTAKGNWIQICDKWLVKLFGDAPKKLYFRIEK